MADYHIQLLPGKTYHLLSRAIGDEKLFRETTNYYFFLSRMQKHLSPVAGILAYCLLPNHFHCMIKIKDEHFLKDEFARVKKNKLFTPELAPRFVTERVGNFLNSYCKAYNKMYRRKGALFIDYCRRVLIEDDQQLGNTLFYIHNNPVRHGYCKRIEDWGWSSYHNFVSNAPLSLSQQEVLDWIGGKERFIEFHRRQRP
jgi:REP element-mobilizing transposase RayT